MSQAALHVNGGQSGCSTAWEVLFDASSVPSRNTPDVNITPILHHHCS
jgi:hypothetical protein